MYIYIVWIKAKNDIDGNPQRGFLVHFPNEGKPLFVKEGYEGFSRIKKLEDEGGNVLFNPDLPIHVSVDEYKRLVKNYSV